MTTTIIETGIDIANANTLIIDRADKYGLSQLHQIRGRVGRGRERAYAYFLYDEDKPLSETGARPARDHRGEQRARRRHADRAQGPRDPRRGQPARRRAVRAHRRRRLRPLPAHDRRGGERLPRRRRRGADRAAARAAGRRAHPRGVRRERAPAARGVPEALDRVARRPAPTTRSTACSRSSPTATASRRRRCRTSSPCRGCAGWRRRPGCRMSWRWAATCGSRRPTSPIRSRCGCSASTPERGCSPSRRRPASRCWRASRTREGTDAELIAWLTGLLEAIFPAPVTAVE